MSYGLLAGHDRYRSFSGHVTGVKAPGSDPENRMLLIID